MNKLFEFFKNLGKHVGGALQVVVDYLPDEQIAHAIELVKEAEVKFIDNSQRREWAVKALMGTGLPEFAARMAVEVALKLVKKAALDGTDKAVGKVVNHV